MGRTLFGVDLDESPFGGLIERLLDEEDLAKLDARPDGGIDPGDHEETEPAGGDETAGRDETDVDRSPAWRTDDREETPDPGGGAEDESEGGRFDALRSRLRPAVLAVAGLAVLAAVLAFVAWRYGDRIAAAVPDRLRRGTSDEDGEDEGIESTGDTEAWSPETRAIGGSATEMDGELESDEGEDEDEDEKDRGGATVPPEEDLGALVALAFLALVAALVRKVTEEQPRDPLIDAEE